MANDGVFVKIDGLPDLKAALRDVVPKLRRKALREALQAGARLVQREARRLAPVLKLSTESGASAVRRGVRTPGLLRRKISVRTSKLATRRGDVGVFVNVRPAKGAQRGAKSKLDPFYWRWVEFGWNPGGNRSAQARRERRRLNRIGADRAKPGARFLQGSASMLGAALQTFVREIGPRIAKLNPGKGAQP